MAFVMAGRGILEMAAVVAGLERPRQGIAPRTNESGEGSCTNGIPEPGGRQPRDPSRRSSFATSPHAGVRLIAGLADSTNAASFARSSSSGFESTVS